MKHCKRCRAEVDDHCIFCPKCGADLEQPQTSSDRSGPGQNINGFSVYTIVIAVLVSLVIVGGALVGVSRYRDKKMFEKTVTADSGPVVETGGAQDSGGAQGTGGAQDTDGGDAQGTDGGGAQGTDGGGAQGTDDGEENADARSTDDEEAGAADYAKVYEEYYNNVIIPEMGTADLSRMECTLTSYTCATAENEWCMRNGAVGMDLADLDSDGQQEMVVYYMGTELLDGYQFRSMKIYADVYDSDGTEITRIGTALLADQIYGNTQYTEKAGIMTLDGKEYIYHHKYSNGIFGNGSSGYYTLYTVDQGILRKAYELGCLWEGSSELTFVVNTYSSEEDFTSVCCAEDSAAYSLSSGAGLTDEFIIFDYDNWYECDVLCWKQLGVDIEPPRDEISGNADYWNSEMVRGGYSLVISSSNTVYANEGQTSDLYSEIEVR